MDNVITSICNVENLFIYRMRLRVSVCLPTCLVSRMLPFRCCDFNHPSASIKPLTKVDSGASKAFRKPPVNHNDQDLPGVRLAFFFTVYADAAFVERLFSRLYSPHHYYLFHIDAAGSSIEFELEIRSLAKKYTNVFCAKDVQIVYGASTATILLTRAMAWFDKFTSGWDYFVPLTGTCRL